MSTTSHQRLRRRLVAATATALAAMPILIGASPTPGPRQPTAQECVVILDRRTGDVWRSDPARCATRLSPASTFKIPHALVALELGVVSPDTVEKWDGVEHPVFAKWDRDHTVASAMKPSVLWFFQRIAPRVGAARMRQWLQRWRYGNARTSGEITAYWVNGTLLVSPDEQLEFLRRFYDERLDVRRDWQRLIREALDQPPGTIENARGISPLEGTWPRGTAWNAKTGRTDYGRRGVSWLVGSISAGGASHVFAAAVWRDEGAVGFLDAAHLAARTLHERGLVK